MTRNINRDEHTFLEFYEEIPLSKEYETDGYRVYEGLENRKIKKYGGNKRLMLNLLELYTEVWQWCF